MSSRLRSSEGIFRTGYRSATWRPNSKSSHLIHLWVKTVLDQAEKAFDRSNNSKRTKMENTSDERRIAQLEAKLANKNEVIAELMGEKVKPCICLQRQNHVCAIPCYPQSTGKLGRWHASVKRECIRPSCPESAEEARRKVGTYVGHYNHIRLHAAIDYVTPADKLNGVGAEIHAERDRKIEEVRARRKRREVRRRMLPDDARDVTKKNDLSRY